MTSERRRLHPAAVGALAIAGLRQLALPIVVVAVLGGGLSVESLIQGAVYTAIGTVFSIALGTAQWMTTWWALEPSSVRLRTGVVSENVTSVPLERVQAIDTVYGPVQRAFGVVELHVQAAGGGPGGEIVLKAVTEAQAEELREAVRAATGDTAAAEEPAAVQPATREWKIDGRRLLAAAATSGSLGVLLPVVAFGTQFADDLLGADEARRLLPDTLGDALALAAGVIAAAWVLSFLGTVVAFAGFTAARDGGRLRIKRGIVERREASVPVARVHAVRVVQNPLREPFGLAQVRLDTAGYAKEPATAQTLLPLVRLRDVPELLRMLLPEFAAELGGLEPVPRSAARRYVLPPAASVAVPSLAVAIVAGPAWLALLGLVAPAAAFGLARHRTAGWRLDAERVLVRTRLVNRTTAVADAVRLQRLELSSNPLQRRAGLATIGFAVASGRGAAVRHLDAARASELFAALAGRAT